VDTMTHNGTKREESPTQTVVQAAGCTGTCTYTWNGQNYVLTGSCSGGGSCPSCPASYDGDVRALVCRLPSIFPDPDDISVLCGLTSSSQVTVPMLTLYLDALRHHACPETPEPTKKP
jgi:hypothetical protein